MIQSSESTKVNIIRRNPPERPMFGRAGLTAAVRPQVMIARIVYILGIVVIAFGCSSNPFVMNPKVEAVLGDSITHSIRNLRAGTYWGPFGHGLKIEVTSPGDSFLYAKDLTLELNGAGMILASLAESELSREWDFTEVYFSIDYGRFHPTFKVVSGVAVVLVRRDTMMVLCNQGAPAWEYPMHASYIQGYKSQPDSDDLLKWRED